MNRVLEFAYKNRKKLFVSGYIILLIIIVVTSDWKSIRSEKMPSRIRLLNGYIKDIDNGEFPQIEKSGNLDHATGMYILAACVGHMLGTDGEQTMYVLDMFLALSALSLFSWETFLLYGSLGKTFILSFFLYLFSKQFLFEGTYDIYVVLGIGSIVVGFPLLLMLSREYNQWKKVAILLCLAGVVAVANMARMYNAVAVFVIALAYAFVYMINSLKQRQYKWGGIFAACIGILFISNNLLATTIPEALMMLHGQRMPDVGATAWHNIYIGFGWGENPYGLYYSDECAENIVYKIDSNIVYGSKEYFAVCRGLVIDLIKADPIFCLKSLLYKFLYAAGTCFYEAIFRHKITLIAGVIEGMWIAGNLYRGKKLIKNIRYDIMGQGLVFAVAFLLGLAPAVLAAPWLIYSNAAYAVILVYMLYILNWMVDLYRECFRLQKSGGTVR